MVLTDNGELYRKLCLARTHGITRDTALMESGGEDEPWYYEQISLGYNYRITDVQCALGEPKQDSMGMSSILYFPRLKTE